MKNLLVLGAGQFSYVVEEIAQEMRCFERIEFLDDSSERAIGKISCLRDFKNEYDCATVAIGNPTVKQRLLAELEEAGFELPNLIHPKACVSPFAQMGKANIVEPCAVIQANSVVGDGCIISSGAVVRHNGIVGSFSHCDCGSVVLSGAEVPCGTKVKCLEIFS